MDNKESELIAEEGNQTSAKEKSQSTEEETSKEMSPSKESPEIEIDLESLERFKELYGIDLTEVDFDQVQARPRLDSRMQRSKAMAVNQEVTTRRLPSSVANKLGSLYPKHRKDLLKLSGQHEEQGSPPSASLRTQRSAPAGTSSEDDVRARLGIGRGNPLAGLASVMKGGLRKKSPKSSPKSSPHADRKDAVAPPTVALKPTKKPVKAPPMKSVSVDPALASRRTSSDFHSPRASKETPIQEGREAGLKTSTPKQGNPPSPAIVVVSPPSRETSRSGTADSSGDLSSLFPRGQSHLFDDDEISKMFVGSEESIQEDRQATPTSPSSRPSSQQEGKKPDDVAASSSKPAVPEWKRKLQERKAATSPDKPPSPSSAAAKDVPAWKKSLLEKRARTTPEPEPVVEKKPEPKPVIEKKPEPKPVIEKKAEPKLVVEKKPEPKPVMEKKAEPVVEKKLEPKPVMEKKAEPVVEKNLEPKPVMEKKTEPEPVIEKKAEPETVVEKKPELKPVMEKKAEPVVEKKLAPKPVMEKKTEPEPVVEKKAEPEPVVEKKPEPKIVIVKKADPEPVVEKKPEPKPVTEKKAEPEPVEENNSEPRSEEKVGTEPVVGKESAEGVPPTAKESPPPPPPPTEKDQQAEVEQLPTEAEERSTAAGEPGKEPPEQAAETKEDVLDWQRRLHERKAARAAEKATASTTNKTTVSTTNKTSASATNKTSASATNKTSASATNKTSASTTNEKNQSTAVASEKPSSVTEPVKTEKKEDLPDWKRRLEERKAARAAELERVKSSSGSPKKTTAPSKVTIQPEQKVVKETTEKKSSTAVPEWKKALEERRKQKEQEETRPKEPKKTVDEGTPAWKERLAQRKAGRESPTGSSSQQQQQPKVESLFDEDLSTTASKPTTKTDRSGDAQDKTKATIDSLFEDEDDVLFKSKMPPVLVDEAIEVRKIEDVLTTPTGDDREVLHAPSVVVTTAESVDVLKDWIVVDSEDIKRADQELCASLKNKDDSAKKDELVAKIEEVAAKNEEVAVKKEEVAAKKEEVAVKKEEVAAKKEEVAAKKEQIAAKKQEVSVKAEDRKPSPTGPRNSPSPSGRAGARSIQHDVPPAGPSWLAHASRVKESGQGKQSRSQTFSSPSPSPSPSGDQDMMPAWRKRILERKKEKELLASQKSTAAKSKVEPAATAKSEVVLSSNDRPKVAEPSGSATLSPKPKTKAESSKTATTSSQVPKNIAAEDEEIPDWQRRLSERRRQREMEREEREKQHGGSSAQKPSEPKSTSSKEEDSRPSVAQIEAPVVVEQSKESSSLFGDDEDTPSWQSKLASRKHQLEQRKDELGVPVSTATSERAHSEPLVDSTNKDSSSSSTAHATMAASKQDFSASSDHLLSTPGPQPDSRTGSVSSVEEVFSSGAETPGHRVAKPAEAKPESKSSCSEDEVRRSPLLHSATASAGEDNGEDTPPRGCVRRTSVKFSSVELEDNVPEWKRKLLERKKTGSKDSSSERSPVHSSKEEVVPSFLKEFRRKRTNSQQARK